MKGSKFAIIKLVEPGDFLRIINDLLKSTNAIITGYDNWMPKSLHHEKEAELKDFLKYNFPFDLGEDIQKWWLKHDATTPNWDLISTCRINGKKGILLVEAKAHCYELYNESHGKSLKANASPDSVDNHEGIKLAIEEAKNSINSNNPGINILISRDKCYQLSNRVAHAWWLAKQGIPVVLMYLGFLNVRDMDDGKNEIFHIDEEWQECFKTHSQEVGVDQIRDKWVNCGGSEFITICRSK